MKRTLKFLTYLSISLIVILSSLNAQAQSKRQIKKAKKIATEEMVSRKIDSLLLTKDLELFINEINPSDGEIIKYSQGYLFTYKDEKLTCNLPYYGRNKTSTYASDNIYIQYDNTYANFTKSRYRGETIVKISANNDKGEEWIFYISLYNNGDFRMSAETINREKIYFSGRINNINMDKIKEDVDIQVNEQFKNKKKK